MFRQTLIRIGEYGSIGGENIQTISTAVTFCLVMNDIVTKMQHIDGANWKKKKDIDVQFF